MAHAVTDAVPMTVTVEIAGAILGMPRQSAYRAAWACELPMLKFGKRVYVPVAKLERLAGRPITRADIERAEAIIRERNDRQTLRRAATITRERKG
jgi:hypothetical protein